MASRFGATFVPGGPDDYYMPEVVAPFPQRVAPQIPQNMQDGLRRLELGARDGDPRDARQVSRHHDRQSSVSNVPHRGSHASHDFIEGRGSAAADGVAGDITAYKDSDSRARHLDAVGRDAPSFSPFPRVTGDNIPPADDAKEEILWNARKHVLHSQNVYMQISWARDVLIWAEIAMDATARKSTDKNRPATPRIEHELRVDALNIFDYLAGQEHPDALYIRSKWLEFGKFGRRVDKREAYAGYRRASELGNPRSEYRMGMLFEQSNDMSKAKEHYYKGMSLKDSAALYRMGMMSLLGQHGESKDYVGGLERIRAAADSADEDAPQAAYVYGMLLGRDLPDISIPDGLLAYDLETAKMYVEKAAYLGFGKAQLKMGQAYELCQLGCDFNPSYSLHYYGLAAKQGLPEAALGVSRWFLFGYEGVFKKNEELAFVYAEEAAASGLATGEFAMGYYYEIGIHVKQSTSDARKWYQMAADHGNKDALGRLESLRCDQGLSKKDHETTTLTKIKSQHGSQRRKPPERFRQSVQMPTVDEFPSDASSVGETRSSTAPRPFGRGSPPGSSPRPSPQPSPGIKPTIVSDHVAFSDPSRASAVGTDRPSAFNIRLDGDAHSAPSRPRSAAPYPDDDRPASFTFFRSQSTAPYPEDDVRLSTNIGYGPGLSRPSQGPQADRPSSAFGIKTQPPAANQMPMSHSSPSLQPSAQPGRPGHPRGGRIASAGRDPHQRPRGGYSQQPPNFGHHPGGQRPHTTDDAYRRPPPSQGPPGPNMAAPRPPEQNPRPPHLSGMRPGFPDLGLGRDFALRPSARPGSQMPLRHDPRSTSQPCDERPTRVPGASGRPERMSLMPSHDASRPEPHTKSNSSGHGPANQPRPNAAAGGRMASAPPGVPGQRPSEPSAYPGPSLKPAATAPATAPAKPSKGPATFEDMGIPHGKQEGDCVVM